MVEGGVPLDKVRDWLGHATGRDHRRCSGDTSVLLALVVTVAGIVNHEPALLRLRDGVEA